MPSNNSNTPFFSVIIPTYNRAPFIIKTLNSLLNQTYSNFEVIVVDDGSTDDTEEVLKSVSDTRLFYLKKSNEERAIARNAGVKVARGEYVNFLDSDDLLYPNHLENARKFILNNNNPELFHQSYDVKDTNGVLTQKPRRFKGNLNEQIIHGNLLITCGVFIRKDIALNFPFHSDRELSGSEDWHLWVRLSARYNFPYSNEVTSSLVQHDLRSVVNINKETITRRIHLLMKYLFEDEEVQEKYGKYKKLVQSDLYLYLALHLAMTGKYKLIVIKYLAKSIWVSPKAIIKRRFYGVMKNLLSKL